MARIIPPDARAADAPGDGADAARRAARRSRSRAYARRADVRARRLVRPRRRQRFELARAAAALLQGTVQRSRRAVGGRPRGPAFVYRVRRTSASAARRTGRPRRLSDARADT